LLAKAFQFSRPTRCMNCMHSLLLGSSSSGPTYCTHRKYLGRSRDQTANSMSSATYADHCQAVSLKPLLH
jgi:hypothetical protein